MWISRILVGILALDAGILVSGGFRALPERPRQQNISGFMKIW